MNEQKKEIVPCLPLKGITVFPYAVSQIEVGRAFSLRAVEKAIQEDLPVFLVTQTEEEIEQPQTEDVFACGTLAHILHSEMHEPNLLRITVEGICRARTVEIIQDEGMLLASCRREEEVQVDEVRAGALRNLLMKESVHLTKLSRGVNAAVLKRAGEQENLTAFADLMCSITAQSAEECRELIECCDVVERLELLYRIISGRVQIAELENKIALQVKNQMDQAQKEYYLREQLKVIHKELGDNDAQELEELRERVEKSDMPENVKEKAFKEIRRMERMAVGMPEMSLSRTYLDWLLDLPWKKETPVNADISHARCILDEDHYGMEKVKRRILEFLAVQALNSDMKSPILCLVGPPGVGKTSIAKSVARALGRVFVRMSLGGVRDEAEIRGHRRTYVASCPGRIISTMKQAGCVNPLFLMDEIDKMSSDYKGDPASAMLEVLDSAQNDSFTDHYLEVPYNLNKVMFFMTANSAEQISHALLDRMELIEVPSYTDIEKLHIAREHLLPKQQKEHGLKPEQLKISEEALLCLINDYTREAGVRTLERRIAELCRRCAMDLLDGKGETDITPSNLGQYLSESRYHREAVVRKDSVGVSTGLAWTSVGGKTLNIETVIMPGSGEVLLTGQLGDVMKESAKADVSLVRSHAKQWGIAQDFYKKKDIHIHIPEGATPKDGPSAGVSILSSMVSALTGIPVRCDTAMTGEITLSGQVLPIGGLKEKSLAACRAGIRRILIPKDNAEDIKEISREVSENIEFVLIENIEQLLQNALLRMPKERNSGD